MRPLLCTLAAPLAFLPLMLYSEAPRAPAPPQTYEVTFATYPPSGPGTCSVAGPWTCTWEVPGFDVTLGTLRSVTLEPYAMAQNRPGGVRLAGSAPIEVTFQARSTPGGVLTDQTVCTWRWAADLGSGQETIALGKASMPSRNLTIPANDWTTHYLTTAWTDPTEGSYTYSGAHPMMDLVQDPDWEPWSILCQFTYPFQTGEAHLLNAPYVSIGPAFGGDNVLHSASASASLIVTYTYTIP